MAVYRSPTLPLSSMISHAVWLSQIQKPQHSKLCTQHELNWSIKAEIGFLKILHIFLNMTPAHSGYHFSITEKGVCHLKILLQKEPQVSFPNVIWFNWNCFWDCFSCPLIALICHLMCAGNAISNEIMKGGDAHDGQAKAWMLPAHQHSTLITGCCMS